MKRITRITLITLGALAAIAAVAAWMVYTDESLSRHEDARWRLKNRGFTQDSPFKDFWEGK